MSRFPVLRFAKGAEEGHDAKVLGMSRLSYLWRARGRKIGQFAGTHRWELAALFDAFSAGNTNAARRPAIAIATSSSMDEGTNQDCRRRRTMTVVRLKARRAQMEGSGATVRPPVARLKV